MYKVKFEIDDFVILLLWSLLWSLKSLEKSFFFIKFCNHFVCIYIYIYIYEINH